MKILVISDTHGQRSAAEDAFVKENPDAVFFLGDGTGDIEHLTRVFPYANVYAVKGNCDFFASYPPYICETLGGVRIYACHGHSHGVKNGFSALVSSAKSMGAQLALFGHTHRAALKNEDGVVLLNPGSAGYYGSYAVVEAKDGAFTCELKTL